MKIGRLEIVTAGGCARRAVYAYWEGLERVHYGPKPWQRFDRKFFHLGIDPNVYGQPKLFGSLFNLSWRIPLPRVKFPRVDSTGQIPNRLHLAAYRVSSWFWCGMDGRDGWFTAHRRKVRKDLKQWCREEQARHEERVRRLVAK
jgi:hypothetical protein